MINKIVNKPVEKVITQEIPIYKEKIIPIKKYIDKEVERLIIQPVITKKVVKEIMVEQH